MINLSLISKKVRVFMRQPQTISGEFGLLAIEFSPQFDNLSQFCDIFNMIYN